MKEEINPFVVNNPIEVLSIKKKEYYTNANDIIEDVKMRGNTLSSNYLIDQQKKISVYSHSQQFIDEVLYGKLNSKARDLYLYIIYHLPENLDYINLKLSKVKGSTGISRNSIVTGLKDLKSVGIIAMKSQSVYWVNPRYFFKGNRIKYYENKSESLLKTVGVIGG